MSNKTNANTNNTENKANTENKPVENKANTEVKKIEFFAQEDSKLEKLIPNKDILEKVKDYSFDDLIAINDDRSMKIKVDQFIPCMCTITKSVTKTKNIFYSMEVQLSTPLKHKMSSDAFNENTYNRLILDCGFSTEEAIITFPVRVRFVKGYSEDSLSDDKSYYAIQVLIPCNSSRKLIIFDYISGGEKILIDLASVKSCKECEEKKIGYFLGRGFKLYLVDQEKSVNMPKNFFESYNSEINN